MSQGTFNRGDQEADTLEEMGEKKTTQPATGDPEVAARLRALRERLFESAKAFAAEAGVNYWVYLSHEKGTRAFSKVVAQRYAKMLKVPVSQILGEQESWLLRRRVVSIVGSISGSSARVTTMPDGGSPRSFRHNPPPDLEAYVIIGNDLRPWHRAGDVLLAKQLTADFDPIEVHEEEAFFEREEGVVELGELKLQPNGLFTVETPLRPAPAIDQKIMSAARVEACIRRPKS